MSQYILSISYGKDSLACLGAIEQLGLPLDRIVHAEVWFNDSIPADLPPMVEFKAKADKIIKERYGIEVEHICALRGGQRKRIKTSSIAKLTRKQWRNESNEQAYMKSRQHSGLKAIYTDSHARSVRGVLNISKSRRLMKSRQTYKAIFYRTYKSGKKMGRMYGFPFAPKGNWCTGELKVAAINMTKDAEPG